MSKRGGTALDLAEAVDYPGTPLALMQTAAGLVVLTYDGRMRFHNYRPGSTAGDAGAD